MISSADGTPLLLRRLGAGKPGGPVVLLGHGLTVHSGLLVGPMRAFAQAGASVWAGDLRGHGGSVSARSPLAHLDPQDGWQRLLDDMAAFARVAFDGVAPERRLMIGGAFSGHLMLELLARDPGLARHLVMAGPLPRQPTILRIAGAFLRMRALTRPLDRPDPQILHHLYGFLRAQLPPGSEDIDTISADPEVVRAIRDDPRGFPTPTLGYWLAVMPGMAGTWERIGKGDLPRGLRALILSGNEDPQSRGGRLLPPLIDWFRGRGIDDVAARLIEGVRANVLIDAPRLPVVPAILSWFAGSAPDPSPPAPLPASHDAYLPALQSLGLTPTTGGLPPVPVLIDLCYAALDDDSRWIELIYRLALGSPSDGQDAESVLEAVFPHWQRAFELREELRQAAALGRLYRDLIDRLDLGVAVLDTEGRIRHANPVFGQTLGRIDPEAARSPEPWLRRAMGAAPPDGDVPLVHEGRIVGVSLVPDSLRTGPMRHEAAGRLAVLRDGNAATVDLSHRAGLLALAYGLTGQEGIAALHLAEGLSNAAIAEAMAVSENTVRSHLKRAFEKIGVSSRSELAHRVLVGPLGWLAAEGPAALDAGPRQP